ncbi:MAG: alanine racemase [Phycisphaeraceae bacterium]
MTQTPSPIEQPAADTHGLGPWASAAPASTLSWVEIDLARIERNLAAVRRLVGPRVRVCAAVKKDAYGLGAAAIATRLAQAGCDMLAVYSTDEAARLLEAGIDATPLLVLMPVWHIEPTGPLAEAARGRRLHLSMHEPAQVAALRAAARQLDAVLPVHVFLDTGMSRSGLEPARLGEVLERIERCPELRLAGVYSHLATADDDGDFAREQLRRYDATVGNLGLRISDFGCGRHIANTCGLLRDRAFHLDMVRPGLGLLGYGAESLVGDPCLEPGFAFEPAMRWLSRVVHVRQYEAGEGVGYGLTHRLDRRSVLGVVPVGYGDGYPLALSSRGVVRVEVDGQLVPAPVLGRVNMDQITVDLTDVAARRGPDAILRGARVELVSPDPAAPNALHRLAALAGSHCYEMLCRLRVPRAYIDR